MNTKSDNINNAIKEQIDIVDFISSYVKLEKRGKNHVGLCPFHNEKTPSFTVNQEKGIFNCFGCHTSGSVIDFYMNIESKTYPDALKYLASTIGIEMVESTEDTSVEYQMIQMHAFMSELYHHILTDTKEGEKALNYLLDRGFTYNSIKENMIGYAPNKFQFTKDALEKRNFNLEIAIQCGLIARNDTGNFYDKFSSRIMIPISDSKGNRIGFTARSLGDRMPKYLNTDETKIFQKRQILFNLSDARKTIKDRDEIVIMEGHLDVVKVKMTGMKNVVGLMGTALSSNHVDQLRTLCNVVTLMFDGDAAGQEAHMKYGEMLLKERMNVYIIPLPDKMDPDDFIEKHGEEMFIDSAEKLKTHFITYAAQRLLNDSLSNDAQFTKNLSRLIDYLKFVQDDILKFKLIEEISEMYEISAELIKDRLPRPETNIHTPRYNRHIQPSRISTRVRKELYLVKMLLHNKEIYDEIKGDIDADLFTSDDIYGIFRKLDTFMNAPETEPLTALYEDLDENGQQMLFELERTPIRETVSIELIDDYIDDLSGNRNSVRKKNELMRKLYRAEKDNDMLLQIQILEEIKELNRRYKQ